MRVRLAVLFAAALVALGAATLACAEGPVPLALKYATGDVITYDIGITGAGGVTAMGQSVSPLSLQGTLTLVQTVTRVFPDGSARVEARLPRAELTVRLDQEQVRFSWADGRLRWWAGGKESMPPQQDLSQAPLLGTPLTYTLTPTGQVKDVALPDPQLMDQLSQALPGLSLTPSAGLMGGVLPEKPVEVGETWRTSTTLTPLGPMLPIWLTTSYTLQSHEETGGFGIAKIAGYSEARLQGSGAQFAPTPEVAITIPEIRQTLTSTEFLNTTAGRLMRGDYDLGFSTRVSARVQGQEQAASVEARMRISLQAR